jgi:hypothetical protein
MQIKLLSAIAEANSSKKLTTWWRSPKNRLLSRKTVSVYKRLYYGFCLFVPLPLSGRVKFYIKIFNILVKTFHIQTADNEPA